MRAATIDGPLEILHEMGKAPLEPPGIGASPGKNGDVGCSGGARLPWSNHDGRA